MNGELVVSFGEDGTAGCVYSDELLDVLDALGARSVRRASHVEPCGSGWSADLSPVGGPVFGPFDTHGEAIAAELAWLTPRVASGEVR